MTLQARINYQCGIPEDRRYIDKTYNAEDEIDRFIIAKVEANKRMRLIIDQQNLQSVEDAIAQDVVKKIDRLLEDTFK